MNKITTLFEEPNIKKETAIYLKIAVIFIIFKIFLAFVELFSIFLPLLKGFNGPIPWANFDGIQYLSIAEYGYRPLQLAFFPLFPLIINLMSTAFNLRLLIAGTVVVSIASFYTILLLWKLARIDFPSIVSRFAVLFLLYFPTAFFLNSIYTESVFLCFILGSFYYARKGNFLISSILGGLASGTRVVGVLILPAILMEVYSFFKKTKNNYDNAKFIKSIIYCVIIVPLGLISYMIYSKMFYGDFLLFLHQQPLFGAERSADKLVLLPQVTWSYVSIFLHVSPFQYVYWKAVLEFGIFFISFGIILLSFKSKIRKSYIIFSLLSLLLPTLIGTFLSIPRFALASFSIFFYMANLKNTVIKVIIIFISFMLEIVLTTLFLRGYFVS